ncbi:glycerate kinase type-2 family protein [Shimia sp. MMG029]|uniref:glycerate kinase type-2 family protein n=1 Tax=Shimia sp. MMG029 TaxID=3021978 RepID=UPI0022FDC86C|nr:glycerate kinase [Shimia sp. MMG029]MDA5559031.1 glycerate kinase [Shimia sp. MMG029]
MMPNALFLTALFEAAVEAADPMSALRPHVPAPPKGRTVVIGAGKGAAQLASAFETLWEEAGHGPLSGVVVTRYGYATPCKYIEVLEAAHPVPDAAGLRATKALFEAVEDLGPDDLVVALICGGGSSLLPCPPSGLTLADEQGLNEALLASGAPISAMNAIRKHVSGIKGGRLAAAAFPARVVSLVVSDVPGDDPAQVASGPTVPDDVSQATALDLISSHAIDLPDHILRHIASDQARAPASDALEFQKNSVTVIASADLSLKAAAEVAEAAGIPAVILSDAMEGEAREVAKVHAAMARDVIHRARPFTAPVVLLSGGETTVTLRGSGGKGGRNSEFLLSFAKEVDGLSGISAMAADTDGIDGSEDNAGAFADGTSAARMRAAGRDPAADLAANNAYCAFEAVADLYVPGPTGTNVNDFRAILLKP